MKLTPKGNLTNLPKIPFPGAFAVSLRFGTAFKTLPSLVDDGFFLRQNIRKGHAPHFHNDGHESTQVVAVKPTLEMVARGGA